MKNQPNIVYVLQKYQSDLSLISQTMNEMIPRVYINVDGEDAFHYSTGRIRDEKRIRENNIMHKTSLMICDMMDNFVISEGIDYRSHFTITYKVKGTR